MKIRCLKKLRQTKFDTCSYDKWEKFRHKCKENNKIMFL